MGGGNGAKSAAKRAMNEKKAGKEPNSQLKNNAASMSIQCKTCFQTFMNTSKAPALTEHASNKHNKTIADCFPDFKA